MAQSKRKDLSVAEKLKVIDALTQKKTQMEVAKEFGISQTQVSRISGKRDEIRQKAKENTNITRKRQRTGKSADVETALLRRFEQMRAKGAPVNGPLLKEKAESLAESLGVPGFEASNGWLYRWKERHNLSYKKMHGESADADLKSAEKWLSDVLPNLIQDWSPEDIYNCDETGLFYRALPDGTYALKGEKVAGGKKCKQRLTVLL